ncbi:MAG TPA: TIGR01777 family protein [Candidatus Hydrogenedentes bacterium]|nr:TIGR01777 family protein [Candidatus Hydrogenedentota bacterium]
MNILVAGASGLIGRALTQSLSDGRHEVCRLVRRDARESDEIAWDPATGVLNADDLTGFDAVVCLSGEEIADSRWSPSKRKRILESRVDSVRVLSDALAKSVSPPGVFVCASAIGCYGIEHGDTRLDESSGVGDDFLAEVCRDWEGAAGSLSGTDVRVVHLRLGIVLSREGGALAKMLLPFRLGLGGKLGSGRQWMSWVGLSDVVRAIIFAIEDEGVSGAVNVTAPNPVRNVEFTRSLAKSLHRYAPFTIPGFVIRMVLGEMGELLLLNGACVIPEKLLERGFEFEHTNIDDGLKELV